MNTFKKFPLHSEVPGDAGSTKGGNKVNETCPIEADLSASAAACHLSFRNFAVDDLKSNRLHVH